MPKPGDHIENIEFYKGVTIVRFSGTVTFDNLKEVQDEYRSKMKGRIVKNILFDVKDITNADSAGVAALIDLFRYMKTHQTGDKIGFINASDKLRDLIKISKTEPLFYYYQTEDDAIKTLE
jgi:anti-anti-sigma factor